MSKTLHVHTRRGLTLEEALRAFSHAVGAARAVAFLSAPDRFRTALLVDEILRDSAGERIDSAGTFEARVFAGDVELRWLNDPGPRSRHRAVLLAERDLSEIIHEPAGWKIEQHRCVETLPQTYLLWGQGTGRFLSAGWSELASARIGSLPIPLAHVDKQARVVLKCVEYLTQAEHGNVIVFDERLCGLEVANG